MSTLKATLYALFSIFSVAVVLLFAYVAMYAIYEAGVRDAAQYACRDKVSWDAEMCRMQFRSAVLNAENEQ